MNITREQIEALTMADVAAAKARSEENRKTRAGSTTVDYVLAQVGARIMPGATGKSLRHAKEHLLRMLEAQSRPQHYTPAECGAVCRSMPRWKATETAIMTYEDEADRAAFMAAYEAAR